MAKDKKTMGQEIDQVDELLTKVRDYLVDVAVIAILKAKQIENSSEDGLATITAQMERNLAAKQSELVAVIAVAVKSRE